MALFACLLVEKIVFTVVRGADADVRVVDCDVKNFWHPQQSTGSQVNSADALRISSTPRKSS